MLSVSLFVWNIETKSQDKAQLSVEETLLESVGLILEAVCQSRARFTLAQALHCVTRAWCDSRL